MSAFWVLVSDADDFALYADVRRGDWPDADTCAADTAHWVAVAEGLRVADLTVAAWRATRVLQTPVPERNVDVAVPSDLTTSTAPSEVRS